MGGIAKARALAALCFVFAFTSPGHAGSLDVAADRQAGRVMLEAFLNEPEATLPAEQSCLGEEPVTVGDYLADTLTSLTGSSSGETRLTMNCDPVTKSRELEQYYTLEFFPRKAVKSLKVLDANAELVQCTLGFQHQRGELAWSRSLQALVNMTDDTIVEGTSRCLAIP